MGGASQKILFTLNDIEGNVSTLSVLNGRDGVEIGSVEIDSRNVKPKALFVPLPGLKTDGHNFIESSVKAGASVVMISEEWFKKKKEELLSQLERYGAVGVIVKDPLKAMQELSFWYLGKARKASRIGITGSNGKTTTKEMLASILSVSNSVSYNEKNFNSVIGLPLSVFKIDKNASYLVFEMATNHPGEMEVLSDLFFPDYALITNIGTAHIGNFGTREAIAKEKKQIFKNFDGHNYGFIYERDNFFNFLSRDVEGQIIPFGESSTRGYSGCKDLGLDGYTIYWEGLQIFLPLLGRHNVLNALAAISVSRELGIDFKDVKIGLEKMKPLFGRAEVIRDDYTFVVDCYNANPDSMREIVNVISGIQWKGKKIAVLGSMYELGEFSKGEHASVVLDVLSNDFDVFIFFGKEFCEVREKVEAEIASGVKDTVGKKILIWTDKFNELIKGVKRVASTGDLVLLKASRGVELERLIPALQKT